jgi:transcriptional regulator with XRE-family HTH domain
MPKKYIPTNVGTIVKTLRDKRNISGYRLAQKFDLGREMITAIEKNRTNPSVHTLINLLEFFGCEIIVVDKSTNEIIDTIKKI